MLSGMVEAAAVEVAVLSLVSINTASIGLKKVSELKTLKSTYSPDWLVHHNLQSLLTFVFPWHQFGSLSGKVSLMCS